MKLHKNFFNRFVFRGRIGLAILTKRSDSVFDCVQKSQLWWIINPINKNDNKCFHYAVIVALNCEKVRSHPERITNIKPFINEYI